jgi:hypothetical protein
MKEVDDLIDEVMQARFQSPYAETVIDDVFHTIQMDENWKKRYQMLLDEHGDKINSRIGKTVKSISKLKTLKPGNKSHSNKGLNSTYSTLGN